MANVTNNDEEVLDKEGFISGTVIGPIMASTACRYKAPIKYPDFLYVGSSIPTETIGNDRFIMKTAVFSTNLDRIAAEGHGEIVILDYKTNKKVKCIPAPLLRAIKLVG